MARAMSARRSTRELRRRPIAAAALLLHVLFAALLPIVGAAHETASPDQRIHVEETGGSSSCPRGHDEHECITCRLVSAAFFFAAACRAAEIELSIHQSLPRAVSALPPRLLQSSPPSSRAPPIA